MGLADFKFSGECPGWRISAIQCTLLNYPQKPGTIIQTRCGKFHNATSLEDRRDQCGGSILKMSVGLVGGDALNPMGEGVNGRQGQFSKSPAGSKSHRIRRINTFMTQHQFSSADSVTDVIIDAWTIHTSDQQPT
jgi:hypothetical protein